MNWIISSLVITLLLLLLQLNDPETAYWRGCAAFAAAQEQNIEFADSKRKKYFFAVEAIIRDEAHVIQEFVRHYIEEGMIYHIDIPCSIVLH